ncbi:MAG: dicarboxylate/amino acid:cation symporter [Lachnospiraceae bacterium]|nr:dicarboxylate/amino acid:cation symporter [Lachnospiraceae bacterium]
MAKEEKAKVRSPYRDPIILIVFVIIGAILGLVFGDSISVIYPIGDIFLNLLFVLLVPLIFFSISSSIANISDTGKVGKILVLTITIFVVTAAIAGIIMFLVTGVFSVDTNITIAADASTELAEADSIGTQIVNTFTVSDFPDLFSRQHILPLIVFTVFFGLTISVLGEKGRPVADWLSNMSLVMYKMVSLLMKAAPLGLGAYFANLTATYGPELLMSYAHGLLIYYPTAIAYFFIFLGLYAFVAAGPWGVKNFFKRILTPALTALGTRSSAAALPLQMQACDELNVPREISSVVVPMGATCHMDGACLATVYEIVLCSVLFNHPLSSIGDFAYALVIAVVASVAVSSVPGGGAAMETMLISSFGFPSTALPILLMMTQLFDAGCTLINSCGDTVASMLVTRFIYGKDWYKRDWNKEAVDREAANVGASAE